MNRSIKIFLITSFFLLTLPGWSHAQDINVGVDIILASQKAAYIDSRLTGIKGQLQGVFNFSSYELYDRKALVIAMGREKQIALLEDKVFLLMPVYFQGNMVVMKAKILSGRRLVVDTQFRVSQGGSFFVGGPKTGRGIIILKVTAH